MAVTYPTLKNGTSTANTMTGTGVTTNLKMLGLGGNDTITGALKYNNYIDGGEGDDTIKGRNLADELFGGSGTGIDTIRGGGGNDTIKGGDGNDFLYGEGDVDTIYGEGGNDAINGGAGADQLWGDGGGDSFQGITYGDSLYMGANDGATDRIVFNNGDNLGSMYKNSGGSIVVNAGAQVNNFKVDPNVANDVDTFDNIVLSNLRAVGTGSFIFDQFYTDSTVSIVDQKSIFIYQTYDIVTKKYENFVAIDYIGNNDYDIVLGFASMFSTKLSTLDFVL